jgi:hypothetical protein
METVNAQMEVKLESRAAISSEPPRPYATTPGFSFRSDVIEIPSHLRAVPSRRLPVSTRLAGLFERAGIHVLGDLHGRSLGDLARQRNCGEKTLRELSAALRLAQHGGEAVLSELAASDAASHVFSIPEPVRELALTDLPASTRLQHLIDRLNIRRLGDLHGRSAAEFLRCTNVGLGTVVEMQRLVARASEGEFRALPVSEAGVPLALLALIEAGLEKLPARDRDILLDRVGARGLKPITLEQLAREYRLTRERVRQVVGEASEHLRKTWGPRLPVLLEVMKKRCEANGHPLTVELLTRWLGGSETSLRVTLSGHLRLIRTIEREFPCWPNESWGSESAEAVASFGATLWAFLIRAREPVNMKTLFQEMRSESAYPRLGFGEFVRLLSHVSEIAIDFADPFQPTVRLRHPEGPHLHRPFPFPQSASRRLVPFSFPPTASAA